MLGNCIWISSYRIIHYIKMTLLLIVLTKPKRVCVCVCVCVFPDLFLTHSPVISKFHFMAPLSTSYFIFFFLSVLYQHSLYHTIVTYCYVYLLQ
jgi:hypothetical protein